MKASSCCIVIVTASNKKEAQQIAEHLVQKKLCAGVNIVPGLRSIYSWKGKIHKSSELLLIGQARRANFSKIERAVKKIHSYECPEILALPLVASSKDYLNWILEES